MNQERNIVILVDSSAVIHRNYHGYPDFYNEHNGQQININTLHGYINYIHKLNKEFKYNDCIHVLDPEGGSAYRKEIYPEYKKNRPETPEDLKIQKNLFTKVLDGFSQRWIQIPGIESDDVIATLAHRHALRGDAVLVLTPDKDLLQLVEDNKITVAKYVKSPSSAYTQYQDKVHDFYNEMGVFQKLGVAPYQVADYLALIGDISDNIIGVKNIGPKKAADLLSKYGDIETIITQAGTIPGKLGDNIRAAIDIMPLMKKLTLTMRNLDVPDISTIQAVNDKVLNMNIRELIKAKPDWSDNLI